MIHKQQVSISEDEELGYYSMDYEGAHRNDSNDDELKCSSAEELREEDNSRLK